MESKELIDLLQFLAVASGLFALIWKGIVEYFKSVKDERVRNIEELVDKRINDRVKDIERRITDMNQEFHRSLIELFKEFK